MRQDELLQAATEQPGGERSDDTIASDHDRRC